MTNQPLNQNLAFDVEMSSDPTTWDGTPQLLGILQNVPVILLVKNQSAVEVFFADNDGSTNGTTMASFEEFVLDCRGNKGNAVNMGFQIGTPFYVTGVVSTGLFKVSILYAK